MAEGLRSSSERKIIPPTIFSHYVNARKSTYASGKKSVLGLHTPQFKGYEYHIEGTPYYYQDNYTDSSDRLGNFSGVEVNSSDSFDGTLLTTYNYGGGLTEEGMKDGESAVYSRLVRFLGYHVEEVRFGKDVTYTFEDEQGQWKYEGHGAVSAWGWEDREQILHNGKLVYDLIGIGMCFVPEY